MKGTPLFHVRPTTERTGRLDPTIARHSNGSRAKSHGANSVNDTAGNGEIARVNGASTADIPNASLGSRSGKATFPLLLQGQLHSECRRFSLADGIVAHRRADANFVPSRTNFVAGRTCSFRGSHARGERYYSRYGGGRRRTRRRAFVIIGALIRARRLARARARASHLPVERCDTHMFDVASGLSIKTRRRFLTLCAINETWRDVS